MHVIYFLQVAPSKDFRRDGADVHSDVSISLGQAVFGGTVRIPGVYDDVLVNVSMPLEFCPIRYRCIIKQDMGIFWIFQSLIFYVCLQDGIHPCFLQLIRASSN